MLDTLSAPTRRLRAVLALALTFFMWQLLNGFIRPLQVAAPLWFWVTDVAFSVVLPALLMALVYASVPSFARPASVRRGVVRLMGWVLLGVLIANVALYAARHLPIADWAATPIIKFDYAWLMPYPDDHPTQFWLVLLYLSLSAGVFEEWFYRVFLERRLAPLITAWPVRMGVTSALFGLVHWEAGLYAVCNAAALGVVFALLIRRTGKLTPAIAVHFAYDMILLP